MLLRPICRVILSLALVEGVSLRAQTPEMLSQFFEGKQVIVKLDMPGTQKGVELYPNRPVPLDAKSYGNRMKDTVTSIHNGDSVMITKVKIKNGDTVEFQLGGGGYGTAGDQTDTSVHFTPADKSNHEKELEDQLSKETDNDRRRELSRELDDLRRDRERRDRRNQAAAEEDAQMRTDQIMSSRARGGSRFNIHFDKHQVGERLTPQVIMAALGQYVSFPPEIFGPNSSTPASTARTEPGLPAPGQSYSPPQPPASAEPTSKEGSRGLKKGMTRAQVEALFGPATESHDKTQDNLTVTTCTFQSARETLKADFVNGVLIQYTVSSR